MVPEAKPQLPPCIVLGVETQIGLAIVRELGRAGVPVIALSHDPHAIGLASRHVTQRVIAGPQRSHAVIDAVNRLATEMGPCTLMTVSEANLNWLNRERARFHHDVRLSVPQPAVLAAVLDKQQTLRMAQQVGITIPRTEEPGSLEDVDHIARTFPFPAVLKWKDANAVAPQLGAAGIEFVKAEYVYSGDELRAIGRRYAPIGQWPLIQQYCAGQGLGQFFFMHQGQAVRRFQHLRIAEWPPEGGFSSVCDAVPLTEHQALQERSIALLQAIGWEGVAMVEYRWDAASGRAVLMEINGRFWGSLPLAVEAGAGFAVLSHLQAQNRALPHDAQQPYKKLRCRMMSTELKRLMRILFWPTEIRDRTFQVKPLAELTRFIVDFGRPSVCYYIWRYDDPLPLIWDGKKLTGRLCRRLRRQSDS